MSHSLPAVPASLWLNETGSPSCAGSVAVGLPFLDSELVSGPKQGRVASEAELCLVGPVPMAL